MEIAITSPVIKELLCDFEAVNILLASMDTTACDEVSPYKVGGGRYLRL